jgi:TrmH family RNA methyltransferase
MTAPLRITSPDNPKVKDAIRLRDRRVRTKLRKFLVEGRREIVHALEAGLGPELVFVEDAGPHGVDPEVARLAAAAERAGARILPVNAAVSQKLAMREGAEGVIGVFAIPDASPDRLRLPKHPLVLAASAIEKPGNVGALLRSADAFGADAFVVEGGTDLWNPNVVRASLGCLFTVPVAAVPAGSLLAWLRAQSLRVIAATPDAKSAPSDVDFRGGIAILVGSEEHGLPPEALAAADARVRIPMRGRADSLNVSVSAGILLYEADRQRSKT